jgi:hypothetical protein
MRINCGRPAGSASIGSAVLGLMLMAFVSAPAAHADVRAHGAGQIRTARGVSVAPADAVNSPSPDASTGSDDTSPAVATPSGDGGNGLWIALGIGGVALVGGLAVIPLVSSRRRPSRLPPPGPPHGPQYPQQAAYKSPPQSPHTPQPPHAGPHGTDSRT